MVSMMANGKMIKVMASGLVQLQVKYTKATFTWVNIMPLVNGNTHLVRATKEN